MESKQAVPKRSTRGSNFKEVIRDLLLEIRAAFVLAVGLDDRTFSL